MSRRDDQGWAPQLEHPPVGLRPLRRGDAQQWEQLRELNRDWLRPWEATIPQWDRYHPANTGGFAHLRRFLRQETRARRLLPLMVSWQGQLVGQLSVSGIVYGSLCSGSLGYWISQRHAGRGIIPVAAALTIDHCFSRLGLHRIEINIRPENERSLRVPAKLGLREEGLRERLLHIDGQWRDHRSFAITLDEWSSPLINRCPPVHPPE